MKNITKLNLKKGDKVIVLSGRDKGKTGIIDRVSVKTSTVLVEGINIVKKHVKVSKKFPTGGVAEVVKPLHVSKIMLICPNCGKPTRIGTTKSGKDKNRICKKCGKSILAGKLDNKEKIKETEAPKNKGKEKK